MITYVHQIKFKRFNVNVLKITALGLSIRT